MNSGQGKKPPGGEGGERRTAGGRFALLSFGAALLLLFAAIAPPGDGGDPELPPEAIAIVAGAPGDAGTITLAELRRGVVRYAAMRGEQKVPKPGDPTYMDAAEQSLEELLNEAWTFAQAEEMGIAATESEVADELGKLKHLNNPGGRTQYEALIEEAKFTPTDIEGLVRRQILESRFQELIAESTPTPSQSAIEDYYSAVRSTKFTQQALRDVRVVLNKDRKRAETAQDLLQKDHSQTNWMKVTAQYSEDMATKRSGGLLEGLAEGAAIEPLNAAIFGSPEGRVKGIVETNLGYFVFEVDNTTPGRVQRLEDVEAQVKTELEGRLQEKASEEFISNFDARWRSHTFCAPAHAIERCANFEYDPHPSSAPPGCYEADPEGGRPEACPAPVSQATPALPGSVTPQKPEGEPLAQRPRPLEDEAQAEAASSAPAS